MSTAFHVGLATTLPPAPTGPAEFVAGALPDLARAARITCFVSNPGEVDPALAQRFAIRSLRERADDPSVDLLVYHIANNLPQAAVYDAAMEGPPGLLEIHDGSLHHTLATRTIGSADIEAYQDLLHRTHGPAGDRLAGLRLKGHPAGIELFMFDTLKELLDRHLGAVVHNAYAADLIALRAPALPVWVVPLSAPAPGAHASRQALGLPEGKLVMAHFGFVTPPKRPLLLLEAFAMLRRQSSRPCHLLFAGEDATAGQLRAGIERLGLADDVTITGYLAREEMDALICAVDVVVSLRFPHVGETSATLGAALAAGRPVVVQETGSWAELPEHTVLRVPAVGDEAAALAAALGRLAADPGLRATLGRAASAYAARTLGAAGYARGIVDAAMAVALGSRVPPSEQLRRRQAAVDRVLADATDHLTTATLLNTAWGARRDRIELVPALAQIPPARTGGRLLDLGGSCALLRLLECVWGYETRGCDLGWGPATAHTDIIEPPGTGLPYGCAWFDVVTCWDVLPGSPPQAAALLAEINRVLRAGGVLVLAAAMPPLVLQRLLDGAGLACDRFTPGALSLAVARKVGLPDPDSIGPIGRPPAPRTRRSAP